MSVAPPPRLMSQGSYMAMVQPNRPGRATKDVEGHPQGGSSFLFLVCGGWPCDFAWTQKSPPRW